MTEKKSGGLDVEAKADFLFEISWEVCNKVGGINTVIQSKIPQTIKRYGDNYILVGPYFHNKVKGIFEEEVIPDIYKQTCEALRSIGIVVHYGRWLTEGNPKTILLDFQPLFAQKDEIKRKVWEFAGVDSLGAGFEFEEPLIWSWAAGMVIERCGCMTPDKKVVAMAHEWLAGASTLYLKSSNCSIGTVFVTHATVLGRCLASSGVDFYSKDKEGKCLLDTLDFNKESYDHNVHPKHQLEKACAHHADVFSTVSEITGIEAGHILEKRPDILVPNGLDMNTFPTMEENSIKHNIYKDKIYHFLLYYFFPYHHINIDDTLIYFTACRYEFHDKGLDVFIKALSKLNDTLKSENSKKNIVVFFFVPAGVRGIKPEIVENKTLFKDIEDGLKDNAEHVMWRLLSDIVGEKPINKETIFTKEFLSELKKKVLKFQRESTNPPLCTHDLLNPDDDILNCLRENNLNNAEDDKVKVIFYPIYLTGADGLLDLNYYEAMQGGHLGVFPSFYEPWGYTPMEAGALGVASITSDLAGFGRYIQKQEAYKDTGTFVLDRMDRQDSEVIEDISKRLFYFTNLQKESRINNKFEARKLANLADWSILINNYIRAHNMATEKVSGS